MAFGDRQRAVGLFSNRSDAEYVLSALVDAGFPMEQVSVIAKNGDVSPPESKPMPERVDEEATTGAVTGTVLGGITGLVVGLSTLAIPGFGPMLLVGEIASALATTAVGAGVGAAAGGLLGGLSGLGVPEEHARVYSDRLSRGDYLVIIDGTDQDIRRAETILRNRDIQEFNIFSSPDIAKTPTDSPASSVDKNSQVIIVDHRDTTI